MPTVLRFGPYRFFFYSSDAGKPPHVHVERGNSLTKFWLEAARPAGNTGFRPPELRRIRSIILEHHDELLESWHEYFGK
jgi:hypothetical protein